MRTASSAAGLACKAAEDPRPPVLRSPEKAGPSIQQIPILVLNISLIVFVVPLAAGTCQVCSSEH